MRKRVRYRWYWEPLFAPAWFIPYFRARSGFFIRIRFHVAAGTKMKLSYDVFN